MPPWVNLLPLSSLIRNKGFWGIGMSLLLFLDLRFDTRGAQWWVWFWLRVMQSDSLPLAQVVQQVLLFVYP